MMPEKERPPQPDRIPEGGLNNSDKLSITSQSEKSKPSENLTWSDYEALLISRYVKGGTDRETAARFAQGETNAILTGSHWTHGKPTPPDPQAVIIHALAEYELTSAEKDVYDELAGKLEYDGGMDRAAAESRAMAEILHRRYGTAPDAAKPTAAPEIPPPKTESPKYKGIAAYAEYTKRGIGLMPCVPCEGDPKRYRPIVGKEKWGSTATADIGRVKEYMSGALWPNVPIGLFRFIPAEAGWVCLDIDKGHSNGVDGEANFYRLMRAHGYDPLPLLLRDLQAFPVRVESPNGGLHLYFSHNGPPFKKMVLAEGVEVFHTDPLTAAGSRKENKAYILHGCLDDAPPLPAELLEIITANEKQYRAPENAYRKNTSIRGVDDKELLKTRLLEYVKKKGITVTKRGGKEWINCPLHDDGEPSMQINVSGRYAGILKCYACGASLNVFGLARIMAGLPDGKKYFPQVAREIKTTLGIG